MLKRRFWILLLFLAFVVVLGVVIRFAPNWDWMVDHEQTLRTAVASAPLRTWCLGLVTYYLLSLIPGSGGKSVAFGWLFGFWGALLIVEVGLTAAAVTSFLVGRLLLGDIDERGWGTRIQAFQRHFLQDGAMYLLLLRLAHTPFTLVNYGAVATKVPVATFAWTTALGVLPGTMVFVFAGSRVPSLKMVAEQGIWSLLDPWLLAALVLTAIMPVGLRALIRLVTRYFHKTHAHLHGEGQPKLAGPKFLEPKHFGKE